MLTHFAHSRSPFTRMHALMRDMDELLSADANSAFAAPSATRIAAERWWREGDTLHFEFDVPGAEPDQLSVEVEPERLRVRVNRERAESDQKLPLRRERPALHLDRSFTLGEAVDLDSVEATLREGILHVRLVRATQAGPKAIPVRGA